ncbi:FAD-dependent oxidoreductase [bacterium]|nr:FAD-dependent oxidoreductase [bacterium]
MIKTDVLIVGAGAVGLSCLNQVPPQLSKILIEKNSSFGQEASSRNSEVIHSGIYYPHHSLKSEHCKVGRNELYRFCQSNRIPYQQCGKYVVATDSKEELEQSIANGKWFPFKDSLPIGSRENFHLLQLLQHSIFPCPESLILIDI